MLRIGGYGFFFALYIPNSDQIDQTGVLFRVDITPSMPVLRGYGVKQRAIITPSMPVLQGYGVKQRAIITPSMPVLRGCGVKQHTIITPSMPVLRGYGVKQRAIITPKQLVHVNLGRKAYERCVGRRCCHTGTLQLPRCRRPAQLSHERTAFTMGHSRYSKILVIRGAGVG